MHHQIHNKDSAKSANIKTSSKNGHGVFKKSPPANEVKHLANAFSAIKSGIAPQAAVPNNKLDNSATKRKLFSPVTLQAQNVLAPNTGNEVTQQKEPSTAAPSMAASTSAVVTAAATLSTVTTKNAIPEEKIPKKPAIPNVPARPSTTAAASAAVAAATVLTAAQSSPYKSPHNLHPNPVRPIERERPLPDIQDILEFIEGISSKKDTQKKAAKKAKQKQKKQDVKKIEALEQMRDEFHEIFFKESDAKTELKTLKGAKKKDKKKVTEAENNVKKYGKTRSKFETSILELIGELKRNNSEFKFAYLPTKEQQLLKQQRDAAAQQPLPSLSSTGTTTLTKKGAKQTPIAAITTASSTKQTPVAGDSRNCEITMDQAKRVVTIRRVSAPHADPEVTITAKGASPDKDKLLYTFVKGQIVPGK